MMEANTEAVKSLDTLKELKVLMLASGDNPKEPVEIGNVYKAFREAFHKDKKGSLTAVMQHLSDLDPAKVVKFPGVYRNVTEELRKHIMDLRRKCIVDCLEKSLENESEVELQELAEFVQRQAILDESEFDVSNTGHVDRLISCMQMIVSLNARLGQSIKILDFFDKIHRILPHFDKLQAQRKLDFLRALAEISPLATAPVADKMRLSIIELLKVNMPDKKIKEEDETKETIIYAYVECLQYVLHHLDHNKTPGDTTQLSNNELMHRLKCVEHITLAKMEKLARTFHEHDMHVPTPNTYVINNLDVMLEKFLGESRRQNAKSEVKTCNNILAMTKVLQRKSPSFIGENIVNLSWKKSRSPSASNIPSGSVMESPLNRDRFNALSKDQLETLRDCGHCELNNDDVEKLMGSSRFQREENSFLLNDYGGIAMLSWEIKQSEFSSFVKGRDSNKGISGKVRNQFYNLICWAYVATDLVSAVRCMQKWEDKCYPLCTWYLCAFSNPEKLGKDERTQKPDREGHIHHCYGYSVEGALCHIQANGIPKEFVEKFRCTDHQPPTADEPERQSRKIKEVRRINTLKEAMEELQKNPKQPIGADLIYYSSLFTEGNQIYYGPRSRFDMMMGYHAVIIEDFQMLDGKLVAVCKMSNGVLVADNGYAYVSVTTQYLPVGVSDDRRKYVRHSDEPMHLLTNVVIIEMDEKDIDEVEEDNDDMEEVDKEDDAKEDDAKEDDAKEDEEPGEEESEEDEYIPVNKRRALGRRGGLNYFSSRALTHVELLKLLRVLGQGDGDASDLMTDILAEVATKTELNKDAGNSLLYECVETIMATEDTSSLRVLVMNILGRFLSNRDNNIRYAALNMLMKAMPFDDDQAVQRHIVAILECVKDPDASIRKRALELVSLLVNETNVKQVTKELNDYKDLCSKNCSIVEKEKLVH